MSFLSEPSSKDSICYHIEGFFHCDYFHLAHNLGQHVLQATEGTSPSVHLEVMGMDKSSFINRLPLLRRQVKGSDQHASCPIIYEGCSEHSLRYIGGYKDFLELVRQRHQIL